MHPTGGVASRFTDFARLAICAGLVASLALGAAKVRAERADPKIGSPAPEFEIKDSKETPRHLSEFRGKPVVLEWTNAECPYTRKHYTSGNMQSVQNLAKKSG